MKRFAACSVALRNDYGMTDIGKSEEEKRQNRRVLTIFFSHFFRKRLTYADSGVSISNGDKFVAQISPLAKSTRRKGCVGSIGGFGGMFDLEAAGYLNPVLVAGTDGVGTKLMVFFDFR